MRIYNTNTKKVILAEFLMENGEFISEEIFGLMALQAATPRASQIDGVARMAALQTLHKAYAVTGAVFLRAAAKVEVL